MRTQGRFQEVASWAVGQDATKAGLQFSMTGKDIVAAELPLESAVSDHIRAMAFLCSDVDDEPGPASLRGILERNSIALLSNFNKPAIDPPSPAWLGSTCSRERGAGSLDLWNNNHVDEEYDADFLSILKNQVG